MDPLTILKQQFGYPAFRLHQEAIIQSVLAKKDTFVLMPTGAGKSICYQIPALMLDGLTIVVSPLIALMKDQVDALRINGIPAAYLNSTQRRPEQESILRDARLKKLKLLYLAPEKLLANTMDLLHALENSGISLLAIDEAHCISHWGHDFRPEYRMLANVKRKFPDVPLIALTATADKLTQQDIVEKLELRDPAVFISSFNRPNIRYTVQKKSGDVLQRLLNFLNDQRDESGIIYCLSRKSTESLASDLQVRGFSAMPYHAGMDREQRSKTQDMFLRDEVRIIVATIAFGMGIDKSNVRYVVHTDLPKNVESYYQETGRAGRDGLGSEALLFYSAGDVAKLKKFALIGNNPEQTEIQLRKLDEMGRYGALRTCRRKYLLNYFDETTGDYCGNCDVCLNISSAEGRGERSEILAALRSGYNGQPGARTSGHAFESALLRELKQARRDLALLEDVPAYMILSDATLIELATYLPHRPDDLSRIPGFGEVKLYKYGETILDLIKAYCRRRGLGSRIDQKLARRTQGGKIEHETHTKQQSLALFRKGRSIEQIAATRKLSRSTVEGHLAFYIGSGELALDELVPVERVAIIREAIDRVGANTLSPIKDLLGDDFSYSEIRYVIADGDSGRVNEVMATEWSQTLHSDKVLCLP